MKFQRLKDMKKSQPYIIYLLLFIVTIFVGLVSRKLSFIPLITGDMLYAIMSYWLFRVIIPQKSRNYAFALAILFCFSIEFLQLLQSPFWTTLRSNPYLRLVFGQGFLWSDLVAYTIGAVLAQQIDRLFIRKALS